MNSRFIALPVGLGDAFYLQREDLHILVDGGRDLRPDLRTLPRLLKTYANPSHLDIVVCTHNDADHAKGIIDLLKERSVSIQEVWLPGTWTWRLGDLVTKPIAFLEELEKNIHNNGRDIRTLEQYYERKQEAIQSSIESSETARVPEQGADVREWISDIFREDPLIWKTEFYKYWGAYNHKRLWLNCMNAAKRIMSIAEAALNASVKIRLFEYVKSSEEVGGGNQGQLIPVNSREVLPRRVKEVSALNYLALTTANRESLVFYSPEQENNNAPAVLFTADSDLACGLTHIQKQKPTKNIIVTAPHHGSEKNSSAYTEVSNWIGTNGADKVIWVRSDSKSKKRPGNAFKSQKKRICTLCNPPTAHKSVVRLYAFNSYWQPTCGTAWCSCK